MNTAKALEHLMFHHGNADGFITLARKGEKYEQKHFKPNEIEMALHEWSGENIYFSQNTFYRPCRSVENVRQLRHLYVDVDCYNQGYNPEWIVGKVEMELFESGLLPQCNSITYSGRGVVFCWKLEPVPYQALPLWQAVENYFFQQFQSLDIGADSKATDASRIFRLAGSINSKNGNIVRLEILHDHEYVLRGLQQDYLPELTNPRAAAKNKDQAQVTQKNNIVHMFNIQNLHHTRLCDLVDLVRMRDFEVTGMRQYICFLYRYWSCCVLNDTQRAIEQTMELNSQFTRPLREREVMKATMSAERAWTSKSDREANEIARKFGYKGAGYNLTNEKVIEWLQITAEEQTKLRTIIGKEEKYRRNNERREQVRRNEGILTRAEYLAQQAEATQEKLLIVKRALEIRPDASVRELSEVTGISRSRCHELMKQLGY